MRFKNWEELSEWLRDNWDERMRANEAAMLRDGHSREHVDSVITMWNSDRERRCNEVVAKVQRIVSAPLAPSHERH